MNIIIFTSKSHLYANVLLNRLVRSDILDSHEVFILEQSCIIPGLGASAGLMRYFHKAGAYYVFSQAIKQLTFTLLSRFTAMCGCSNSPLFPYYLSARKNIHRRVFDRVKENRQQDFLRGLKPDLILSLLSKEILPEKVLSLPVFGCVNLHPAPLPAYRGVSPTFWCLADGAPNGGVTLHWMKSKIDTGEIISQKSIPLQGILTEHELYMRCISEGGSLVIDFLKGAFPREEKEYVKPGAGVIASYRSLPTKKAVISFKRRGYSFYKMIELVRMAGI